MENLNLTSHNVFLNKINIHLNMFGALVLNLAARKVGSTDIIIVHKSHRVLESYTIVVGLTVERRRW